MVLSPNSGLCGPFLLVNRLAIRNRQDADDNLGCPVGGLFWIRIIPALLMQRQVDPSRLNWRCDQKTASSFHSGYSLESLVRLASFCRGPSSFGPACC